MYCILLESFKTQLESQSSSSFVVWGTKVSVITLYNINPKQVHHCNIACRIGSMTLTEDIQGTEWLTVRRWETPLSEADESRKTRRCIEPLQPENHLSLKPTKAGRRAVALHQTLQPVNDFHRSMFHLYFTF